MQVEQQRQIHGLLRNVAGGGGLPLGAADRKVAGGTAITPLKVGGGKLADLFTLEQERKKQMMEELEEKMLFKIKQFTDCVLEMLK